MADPHKSFTTGSKEGGSVDASPKKKGTTETTHIRVENNQKKTSSSSAPGPHNGVPYVY